VTHEVTHVVFYDATHNPFHEPAHWFNEGLAVWSEQQSASAQHSTVESAAGNGLLAFDGIAESFPISATAAGLSYAEGATMVQMIIDHYGRGAIARIIAAYSAGAGDEEALQAGTGVTAAKLYATYFAAFGVAAPQRVQPAPILPSNVNKPPQPLSSAAPATEASPSPTSAPTPAEDNGAGLQILAGAIILVAIVGGIAFLVRRRAKVGAP